VGSEEGDAGGASEGIVAQGSSTVQPITQAAAEAFSREKPGIQISVGGSDPGDDFESFCDGEADMFDASRPMQDQEIHTCQENGVEFIELAVAMDALAVVVNPQNDFAKDITLDELRLLWAPSAEGQITSWNQVRSEWPDRRIDLYGPGGGTGGFEFFTERVVGGVGESRPDYQESEDDDTLAQGMAGDPNALGYLGFSSFEESPQRLEALAVEGIEPGEGTIGSSQYPLSRPLFVYVSLPALEENPSIEEFMDFYLDNLDEFVEQAGYVPLAGQVARETRERFQDRTTGTAPESTTGGEKEGTT
jgi:phosphate transport system substrate-binding protein